MTLTLVFNHGYGLLAIIRFVSLNAVHSEELVEDPDVVVVVVYEEDFGAAVHGEAVLDDLVLELGHEHGRLDGVEHGLAEVHLRVVELDVGGGLVLVVALGLGGVLAAAGLGVVGVEQVLLVGVVRVVGDGALLAVLVVEGPLPRQGHLGDLAEVEVERVHSARLLTDLLRQLRQREHPLVLARVVALPLRAFGLRQHQRQRSFEILLRS